MPEIVQPKRAQTGAIPCGYEPPPQRAAVYALASDVAEDRTVGFGKGRGLAQPPQLGRKLRHERN